MSDVPLYRQWREKWQRDYELSERLEALAAEHPELPFEVASGYQLQWNEIGETLSEFGVRVKRVSDVLGPPESVSGDNGYGSICLQARWEVGDLRVQIENLAPEGCPVDPDNPGRADWATSRPHPRCRVVLKELEDYNPAGLKEGG